VSSLQKVACTFQLQKNLFDLSELETHRYLCMEGHLDLCLETL